jgi:hypothetical protein
VQVFLIRRSAVAATAHELDVALMRLRAFEGLAAARSARWLHSYALREADGRLGLACVFEADGPGALQAHARITRLPVTEVLPVTLRIEMHALGSTPGSTHVHLIRRRRLCPAWADAAFGEARLRQLVDTETADGTRWLRSYVVRDNDGTLGSLCLHQGTDQQAVRDLAVVEGDMGAETPPDAITPVLGCVIFRKALLSLPAVIDAGPPTPGAAASSGPVRPRSPRGAA